MDRPKKKSNEQKIRSTSPKRLPTATEEGGKWSAFASSNPNPKALRKLFTETMREATDKRLKR